MEIFNNTANHKCANLDPKNIKRMRIIHQNGGSRTGLPEIWYWSVIKRRTRTAMCFQGIRMFTAS